MARFLGRGLPLLLALLFLAAGAAGAEKSGVAADPRLTALLAKMMASQKGVQTLRVNFTQTNTFAMLAKPQVLKGTLTVRKPTTVLYAYRSPSALYFRVKDGDLLVYNAERGEAFVQDIRRHEGRIAKYIGITQPLEELQKTFAVSLTSVEKGLALLTLVPTKPKVKEKISSMHFGVREEDGVATAFDIVEAGGDKLAFAFEGWEINPKLTDADFDVAVPPGVKIRREMLEMTGPFGR